MVTIIKLYILFICINFGWGMLATGIVEASIAEGGQSCPAEGIDFNEAIHHKLCLVGIQAPDALQFDTGSQSPDVSNNPAETDKIFRNVTSPDGTSVYSVLVTDGNRTGIATSEQDPLTKGFGGEFFSWLDSSGRILGFGAKIFFDTFTGGFILDVLGTGIVGVEFPTTFLDGIKILIGLAIASYFGYLFLGKPLIE